MGEFLLESIELGFSIVAIAEKTYSNPLPIASTHRKCFACWYKVFAISTIIKLMVILHIIVRNT